MADDTRLPALPPPPRLLGDPALDTIALREWMYQFYSVGVLQTGLLDPSFQSNAGDAVFDADALPNPARTTIARAQLWANEAFRISAPFYETSVTVTGANNEITIPFPTARDDTNYRVVARSTDFTGTPSGAAFIVARVTKAQDSATILLAAAPGSGTSVTFEISFIANLNE
ncbi:MAG: hypothetical protein AB7F39_06555 [Variibacter sp.]